MIVEEIQVFESSEFGKVRTWVTVDGEPYFCGVDVAKALKYADPTNAIKNHCKKDGVVIFPVIDRKNRKQNAKFLTEGNLYRLVMRSKLPGAEKFQTWICDEVLPSLRKYSTYTIPYGYKNKLTKLINLFNGLSIGPTSTATFALMDGEEKIKLQATSYGLSISYSQVLNATDVAKKYNHSAQWLNDLLCQEGIHDRQAGVWQLTPKYANKGYAIIDANGTKYWTPKGRKLIDDIVKTHLSND